MNATIVSSFPAMHSFRSTRGVALAFIVLLHVAFFFALSSGLGIQLIKPPGSDITVVDTKPDHEVIRPVHTIPIPDADSTQIKIGCLLFHPSSSMNLLRLTDFRVAQVRRVLRMVTHARSSAIRSLFLQMKTRLTV